MIDLGMLRQPRLAAAAACFLLGIVVLGAGLFVRLSPPQAVPVPPTLPITTDDEFDFEPLDVPDGVPAATEPVELVVYISGAVLRPDVYQLPAGARVKDVVMAAGGFDHEAATEQINLAEPLSDATHIHVPRRGVVDEAGPQAESVSVAGSGPVLLDLNRATPAELQGLPGVGPVLAERIATRRIEQGPYTSVEQLRDVTGIGDKLFAQLVPLVMVTR